MFDATLVSLVDALLEDRMTIFDKARWNAVVDYRLDRDLETDPQILSDLQGAFYDELRDGVFSAFGGYGDQTSEQYELLCTDALELALLHCGTRDKLLG